MYTLVVHTVDVAEYSKMLLTTTLNTLFVQDVQAIVCYRTDDGLHPHMDKEK